MSEPPVPPGGVAPSRPPAFQGGALRIGTALGIPIRVHVTFLILLFWFGTLSAGSGEGFFGGVVFILLLFGCVVLHELGHAAMARRYGVETREIVLYPIGGVARLDRMPSGKAELLIALAGPAVNLVLAGMLFLILALGQIRRPGSLDQFLAGDVSILWQLLSANLILFFFNLTPAFPMDGGRVLRAMLSLYLGQARATQIAAVVGQAVAVVFAILAVYPPPMRPLLLLVAFFVFVGAGQEAAFERSRSAVAGLTARDAMVTKFETVAPQDSIGRVADLLIASHQQDFPVIDAWGRVAGVLSRVALLGALASGGRETPVLDVMDRQPRVVPPELPLEQVFRYLQSRSPAPVLVAGPQGLVGMVTLENLGELIAVSRSLKKE
jgi:Zn-dependent protease